jgi:hypothetical protein
MPVGKIAALPAPVLALLQMEAEEAAKSARSLADWLNGAIALRYAERAADARRAEGKDSGTIRLEDGEVTVVADLPKKVEWDQGMLARMVERIRAANDDPADYVEIAIKVPERRYAAWPPALREGFAAARTVGTGKPTFRLMLGEGEAR